MFAFQGYGLANLWILAVVTVGLSALVFKTSRYWVHYQAVSEEAAE